MLNQDPVKRSFADSEDYLRRSAGRDRPDDESDDQDDVQPADEDEAQLPGELSFPAEADDEDDQ